MYEEQNGRIIKIEEIQTKKQNAVIKTAVKLAVRSQLMYDSDHKKILATILKTDVIDGVLKERVMEEFEDNVIFEFDSQVIETISINGVSEISFDSEIPGLYKVKTTNENIDNGEVIFSV